MAETIRKFAWTPVRNRAVLFARTRGQTLFFNVGGKPKPNENDLVALLREVEEETTACLKPETVKKVQEFSGPCYGKPPGTILNMACYDGEGDREPVPSREVAELAWFTSADMNRTTETGQTILRWFREQDLID